MKKIAVLGSLLLLSACIKAGGMNFWPERNVWVEQFQTLPITFYDDSMHPVKSELLTERSFPVNRVLSASVGYSVVDDKTYRKVYYAKEVVRANMDGGLVSGTYPVEYKKGQQLDLFGEVIIDDKLYALISAGDKDFYALIDEFLNNEFYKRDYEEITRTLIADNVTYEQTAHCLKDISDQLFLKKE